MLDIMSADCVLFCFLDFLAGVFCLKPNGISLSLFRPISFRGFLFWTFWFLGIASGCLLFYCHDDIYLPLMCRAMFSPVSIVGSFVTLFFPLLIFFLSVYFHVNFLIYLLVIWKGVGIGFIIYAIGRIFNCAGWLVAVLFLFSNLAILPCMLLLLLRTALNKTSFDRYFLYMYLFTALFAGILDHVLVSPLFCRLISPS